MTTQRSRLRRAVTAAGALTLAISLLAAPGTAAGAPLPASKAPAPTPAPGKQKLTQDGCTPAAMNAALDKAKPVPAKYGRQWAGRTIASCVKVNAPVTGKAKAARDAALAGQAKGAPASASPGGLASRLKAAKKGAAAQALAYIQPPQWCFDHAFNGWWSLRTDTCQIRDVKVVYIERVNNGPPIVVGTAMHLEISYIYSTDLIDRIGSQIRIRKYFGERAGALDFLGLQRVLGWSTCLGDCKLENDTGLRPGNYNRTTDNDGSVFYEPTHDEPGAITFLTPSWNYFIEPFGFEPSDTVPVPLPPFLRCDNAFSDDGNVLGDQPSALTPPTVGAGCVIPTHIPTWIVNKHGFYPTVAWHIEAAQKSGLPGAYPAGTPLHRTQDSAKRRSNGDKACPPTPTWIRPANKSCDEYPMRSTLEGASTATPPGVARTFAPPTQSVPGVGEWCEMDAAWNVPTKVTGPTGWSSCMLPATDNSSAGGLLRSFYASNRVLDNDAFRVWPQ